MNNGITLLEKPKLIDAFIMAREKGQHKTDWIIRNEHKDCSDDKCYYICRWLNHSFMPFSQKQEILYLQVKEKYSNLNAFSETKNRNALMN